ncbi:SGNH hydrolase domain-containing protein, partial [Shewanella sp.]|uniref:SGNH hydrolase domain-containing protein n=1 Tax=Shewanella sp. TaxID=50422 RepID=UPI003F2D3EAB
GVLGSVLFGELSLRWVENPMRKGLSKAGLWGQCGQLAVVTGAVGLAAVLLWVGIKVAHPILAGRVPPEITLAEDMLYRSHPRMGECRLEPGKGFLSPMCRYGAGDVKAMVVGDSHANSTVSAVAASANGSVIEMSYTSCPTIKGIKRRDDIDFGCTSFNDDVIAKLNSEYKDTTVLIVNRSTYAIHGQNEDEKYKNIPVGYFDSPSDTPSGRLDQQFSEHLIDTMCSLENSERVYLVRPIPEMGVHVPNSMVRSLMFGKPSPNISISLEEYHARHKVVWAAQDAAAAQCGVKILDPLPYLCHNGRCWGSKDGRPLYSDDDHLSEYGNKLLVPMFKEVFAAAAPQ